MELKVAVAGLEKYKPGVHLAPLRMITGWNCEWNVLDITYDDNSEPVSCDMDEDLILLSNRLYKPKALIIDLGYYGPIEDGVLRVTMSYENEYTDIAQQECGTIKEALECINHWMIIGTAAANQEEPK